MNHTPQSGSIRMTEGPIARQIVAFAVPLMLGNLFQQLYNTADSLIVGNFLGSEALAAVSSSANLIHLLVGFFQGIAIGAGVVISHAFGAKDTQGMRRTIHTFIVIALLCGLAMTFLGVTTTPIILRLINTPESVLPNSIAYFRTYFMGSLAFVMYNACMGILQAVGDSRHPLQYLVISSCVNIALDIVFVGLMGKGVAWAAFATVISQFVSVALCMALLLRSREEYRVELRSLGVAPASAMEILRNGLPAGLTNSIISLANVVVQGNINAFGAAAMAGCGAHSRVEGFGFLPMMCFNMALTTFISQNLGAGRLDRVKEGIRKGIGMSMIVAESVALVIFIFSPQLIGLFDRNPEVIAFGVMHERTTMPFFFLLTFTHGMAAVFRGAGKSAVPLGVMLAVWCLLRVTYVTIAVRFFPVLRTVSLAYPITWFISSAVFLALYLRTDWNALAAKSSAL